MDKLFREFGTALLAVIVLGGCFDEKKPGIYCEKQADCTNPAYPVCYVEFHACYNPDMGSIRIPCTSETAAQRCKDKEPVCGDDKFCRGCVSHSECPSQVCKPDGSCAAEADVAYVDNKNGSCSGNHTGTKNDPVCQIAQALVVNKPVVKVAGSSVAYDALQITATGNQNVTFVGPGQAASPKATISKSGFSSVNLAVNTGITLTVTMSGFDLQGSKNPNKAAVLCQGSDGIISLTLKDVSIHDSGDAGIDLTKCAIVIQQTQVQGNQGVGISTSGGSVTIQQTQVQGNQGVGISTSGGSVTIQQTQVQGNVAGGITLGSGTMYNVVNNVINLNRSQGVSIDKTATGTFAFNTVTKNTAAAGAGGIACGDGAAKTISNSIVWGNSLDTGSQLGFKCTVENVVTGPADSKGMVKTPAFVSTTDFHLKPNDPANTDCCVDKISSGPDMDFDGTKRPQGASWDIGAHERQ